jgi:hypothetical protein
MTDVKTNRMIYRGYDVWSDSSNTVRVKRVEVGGNNHYEVSEYNSSGGLINRWGHWSNPKPALHLANILVELTALRRDHEYLKQLCGIADNPTGMVGKALSENTLVLTPSGPKRLVDLKPGDTVLERPGSPSLTTAEFSEKSDDFFVRPI